MPPVVLQMACVAGLLGLAVLAIVLSRSKSATAVVYGATLAVSAIALIGAIRWLLGDTTKPGDLALPIGLWQELGAAGVGFTLFLTAWQRGRDLFVARVIESTSILTLVAIFVGPWGLHGATWAYVVGAALGQSVVVALAVRAEGGREAFVPQSRGGERPERAGTLAA